MAQQHHERSWSFGDQHFTNFMFADSSPYWNQDEEALDIEWQTDIAVNQCPPPDPQTFQHMLSAPLHFSPWNHDVVGPAYSTPFSTDSRYHSPMLDGSVFATTSSASSVDMIPLSTPNQTYFEPTGHSTRIARGSTLGSDSTSGPLTSKSQLLAPAVPTLQDGASNVFRPVEKTLLPQPPPSPRTREMSRYGTRNQDGTWSCRFERCASHNSYRRPCDLRKHYQRHLIRYFCSQPGCAEAEGIGSGFSSRKDCARHEQSHNPQIRCEWPGCDRVFSRRDNMRDHVKRIHQRPRPRRRATTVT